MPNDEGAKEQKAQKTTLRDFIEKNHNLFTVMGVFAALTALFTRFENAEYLVVISFLIFLVLDIQLWVLFPKSEHASFSIVVFEDLMQIFLFALFAFLVQNYIASYLHIVLPFIFFGAFIVVGILLIKKLRLYEYVRRIAPEDKLFSVFIRALVAGSVMGLIFLLAFYVSQYLLSLLGR